jgi:hypothetical protein
MKQVISVALITLFFGLTHGGTIKDMTGKVDILGGDKWQKAALSMEIKNGDKIMTGINSSVRVETAGGFFEVKELSIATFKEANFAGSHDQKISLETGKVKVRFSKVAGEQSSFKVQTPRGTASVLGSEEDVGYTSFGGMTVDVIDGHIGIFNNQGNGFAAGRGEHGGVAGSQGLFGNFDNIYTGLDQNNPFSDNDTENNTINGGLRGFTIQFIQSQAIPEPERL